MKSYARLIEYVQYIHQFGAYLGRQPDALAFASGQRGGRSRKGKVFQPDIHEESHPVVELFKDVPGDGRLLWRELFREREEPSLKSGDFHIRYFADVLPVDLEQQAFLVKPFPVAYGTFDGFDDVIHHPLECDHLGIRPAPYPEQFVRTVY